MGVWPINLAPSPLLLSRGCASLQNLQEALLLPMDRATRCQSKPCQLLHNCRNNCTANPQQNKVMESEHRRVGLINYVRTATTRRPSQVWSTSSSVDEFRWQCDRLAESKFLKSRVRDKVSRASTLSGYTRISLKQSSGPVKGSSYAKISSIHSAVSIELRL